MTTLQQVELGVLGPLQVRQYGLPVSIPGAKPRAILTMLGLHGGSVVSADTLVELLWGDEPPRTAAKALQTHISSLRRTLGDGFVLTEGTGWTVAGTEVDASRYKAAARLGREAAASGDTSQAVARFDEALTLWRGTPELPDGPRGVSEKTRWIEGHAALVEDRADALLATGRAAEIIGDLEAAVGDAPLRERRWGQLMLALYRAGRQGEALGAYQRARSLLADELGVDPGPDLRRLEAAIVAQDDALEMPVSEQLSIVTRAVTFLLTDIEGSTAAWEADADAMAAALARHDEVVEQVVTSRGGRLIKTRGEGDATFSVFDRPSAAAAAAIELQEAIRHEPWALSEPMRIRVALHTGEVELRDGDYFGRAVNRAARLRSLAAGGQILCSGATAELVIDSLSDDVILADLGMRQLKNLARAEHVFELRLENADDSRALTTDTPLERPGLPAVLAGPGPFVGRGRELERLLSAWQTALDGGAHAVLIAGEPGVGKTRLAGEWSRHAYDQGAVVLYGRCDEDLGAPYQPFAEALRALIPCLGTSRLQGLRGVEALLPLVPGLTDVLPDLAAPTRADPDTERYALFDAVVAVLGVASASAPVVLILDDLHWAAKPTLLLLRHLLRFGEHARVQIVGTYRSTDLDRSHPLAAMLADLHRDGSATRLQLSGLDEVDVSAYVAEAGYDDEELARALASVTGGNPFFLIEALRHVDESGGRWDPSTLPQGVREAVSRRLSRLPAETNKALAAAAVVGSRFALELVERVVGDDLIDAFDEACKAGIIIEEPGGRYRFNHAIVRQSLLAELASVRRMRLHQRIAAELETEPGAEDELLAELAHHYFECAWAGNAAKAVDYCRRAADQAMARLAYEGAADLYDRALHALEELDEELPDRDDQQAELLVARCEALLAAGDVVSAAGAVSQLQEATRDSARLAAWGTCFDGQLSMLTDPERLDEIEAAVCAAAEKLAGLDDAAGEAKAHTVRAACLGRLGRIADCETALDQALTAARRAGEHRLVNAVLAGAPLAALWGPNPVPRAGGRCLDVVRLLRITTGSPVVEATSTRCQAVLDALRGRAAAGRSLLDSARRTLTELGMRHALLEVDQFAGILELVADDPAAAEPYLRRAYNGFRRMGLDADTAETAAMLARACLALDRDAEADELCTESERLAGHALKASIAWRSVRAQLLARRGDHHEARQVAEDAVAVAERTDALVDHGDACLALAMVLSTAGDAAGAQAAAENAVGLYELKGAAALAEKARGILGERILPAAPTPSETRSVEPDNACVQAVAREDAAFYRGAWDEVEQQLATDITVESRRRIVGVPRAVVSPREWIRQAQRFHGVGMVRYRRHVVATRGERLALSRLELGTEDVSPGAPHDELLQLWGIDSEGRIALEVWFDLEDIDAAIAELDAAYARFEEQAPRPPLENAASRADARCNTLFGDNRLDEISALFSEDTRLDDRRQGLRRESNDRATAVQNIRAIAALDAAITKTTLALRGDRLCLSHMRFEERATQPAAFCVEALEITEVNADGLMVAKVDFDLDDIDAAIAELDARYLAGEAADYAHTWSVILEITEGFNRRELPAGTTNFVNLDHRRGAAFAPGELSAYVRATWDLSPQAVVHVAAVHRLSNLGAVVTHAADATSEDGFTAEWRVINLLTVDGDLMSRCEIFDETDLDAALARFDELSRPAPRLENAASRAYARAQAYIAARNWIAVAETLTEDLRVNDRRPVVGAGVRHGRDEAIADMRATADLGITKVTSTVIATHGKRLMLVRARHTRPDQGSGAFHTEVLGLYETNADDRIAAVDVFGFDQLDAAFEELDTRYLAGEAAAHARTWSAIARAYAGFNRGEIPAATENWVNVDHRHVTAMAPGDLTAYMRATWEVAPDLNIYIETVHRLSDLGAVFTHVGKGTSQDGFEAEWREIVLATVDGNLINRIELFDETDIDAALARFDQLNRPASRLENAASRVYERMQTCFTARDWNGTAEAMAADIFRDDRRRVVSGEANRGREAAVAEAQASADLGAKLAAMTVVAIRGQCLALIRSRFSNGDPRPEVFHIDSLSVVEIDGDDQVAAHIMFDPDDFDAAFEEPDARFLAGEAAAHAHTWSVLERARAAFNRHEFPPATPGSVNIDHRAVVTIKAVDLAAYIRAGWDITPDIKIYIETVHRLSNLGAVYTQAAYGTSQEGFDAEWRMIGVVTIEGDLIDRREIFDEADLDAAVARFDELSRPAPQLENTASRVYKRFNRHFAGRDWDEMAEMLADDIVTQDRRRVVNARIRRGRDAAIAETRAIADVGTKKMMSTVVATRGERLALSRTRAAGRDERSAAFHTEALNIIEIDADIRIAAYVAFDFDDIYAAFEELDARYVAGEAAAHARTWSVIAQAFAATNRREMPEFMPDFVNIDHRRARGFPPGDLTAYMRATWELAPDVIAYAEAVHQLSNLGAVFTQAVSGTSQDGFGAEWREIVLATVDGNLINRIELFEEADIEAALTRFEQLSRPAPPLENTANRVLERYFAHFAAREWDAMAETLADDFMTDDRRRVVNAGVRHGRAAEIANMQAFAEVGTLNITLTVMATRGERLVLVRDYLSVRDWSESSHNGVSVMEINADNQISAHVLFDRDDFDAAFEELEARYLAGEAAAHAHTWSVLERARAAFNRHEFPPATPGSVNIDHRAVVTIKAVDLAAYIRAGWDITPDIKIYIETVHRLSNLGAVYTQAAYGTSQEGFDAEWRMIGVVTIEGDLIDRREIFDEADLDAAVARFDELSRPAPQLENTASRVYKRFNRHFAGRDWDEMAEMLADDIVTQDRRRVVNARIRRGRDAAIAETRAIADVGTKKMMSTVVATRGERLALSRTRAAGRDERSAAFHTEALNIIEIDADIRIAAYVAFDFDDIYAAFAELDARYLAGDAAAHAHTWSVIAEINAALNRHEVPATTPDWVNVDHRHVTTIAPGDLIANLRAAWDLTPQASIYIEAVHRLSDLGAVFTNSLSGTSQEGFEAEWRTVVVMTIDGDLINRCELFDAADLDAALARFDELSQPAPRLENAASRAYERMWTCFAARDWNAMAETLAPAVLDDDRRRVVNAGVRHGRESVIASVRAIADVGAESVTSSVVATRGERLVLSRVGFSARRGEVSADVLDVAEIDVDNRIVASVVFDFDDIDAAFDELEARYLAGEAAAHARTWSVIAGGYAAFNRHEVPATTPDWVNIDHRRAIAFTPGELTQYIQATWDVAPDISIYIEAVHELSNLGAVVTQVTNGTSQEGFDAEWQEIALFTVEGDLINRVEIFDPADFDAALARFDELSRPARRLENAASRTYVRFNTYLATRDWDAMAEMLADDVCDDDRRVVSGGIRRGRDAQIANLRAIVGVGVKNIELVVIATRGERLALSRARVSGGDQRAEAFGLEMLSIVEIDTDDRIAAGISFDVDDIDAAFAELDARYLAGEAAEHSHTWSVITRAYAALNRRELAATTPDWVNIDHRRGIRVARGELTSYIRTAWDVMSHIEVYIEAVHRLTDLGAVVTRVSKGTSKEGFDAEWREIDVTTVEGDLINRSEKFDDEDIGVAVARFDELNRPAPPLENAAIRVWARQIDALNRRDVDGFLAGITADGRLDDRRKGLRAIMEGPERLRAFRELFIAPSSWQLEVEPIAIRGSRLSLTRERSRETDDVDRPITVELLTVIEVGDGDLVQDTVSFDPDDIDAAFAELDARYLAGEAAAYSHTWSLIAQTYAAFNRQELSWTSPDWVNIDHRRGIGSAPGDMLANVSALWEVAPDISTHIEAVHRLSSLGAVFTHTESGTSQEGFAAEWREVALLTIEGDAINRCELFDEADIDAAIARFDELSRPTPRLENAASRVEERCQAYFAQCDWDALAELMAEDMFADDRRRVVGAGVRRGRDAEVENLRAWADVGVTNFSSDAVAIRGRRLVLSRVRLTGRDQQPDGFHTEVLRIVEIDADERIVARIAFDLDDIDTAFVELDARYLAGEAAEHSHTWSVIASAYAALNRRELAATTPDWVNIDGRRGAGFAPGDAIPYVRAAWDVAPDINIYIEAVHRLSDLGAVVTQVSKGTSQQGFDAEWREIALLTFAGDAINHCEIFDESDPDAALTRFDDLSAPMPQLKNAASRAWARAVDAFNRRDPEGFWALAAADARYEDRRKGLRDEGPATPEVVRALFEAFRGLRLETERVAIRGAHLALTRDRYRDTADPERPTTVEVLTLTEVADDDLVRSLMLFDPDDIDGAMGELTSRWIASGEVAHPQVIEAVRRLIETANRHDWDAFTTLSAGATYVNHRQLSSQGVQTIADHMSSIRTMASLVPDYWVELAEVLTYSARGLVGDVFLRGTATDGLAIEIPLVMLLVVDRDRVTGFEAFDPDQRVSALARFEELSVKDQPK